MEEKEERLPTTPQELDNLVAAITSDYNVPNDDDTYEAIATAIMHLPPNAGTAKRNYFGNVAVKCRAQIVAYTKLMEFDAKRKEKQEKAKLKVVPQESGSVGDSPLQNA